MELIGIHDIVEYTDEIKSLVEESRDCESIIAFTILKFIRKNEAGNYEVNDIPLVYLPSPRYVIDIKSIVASLIELHMHSAKISRIEMKNAYNKLIDEVYKELESKRDCS